MGSPLVEIRADSVSQTGSPLVEIRADSVSQNDSHLEIRADFVSQSESHLEIRETLGLSWLSNSNTTQMTTNGSTFVPIRHTKTVSRRAKPTTKPKPILMWGSEAGIYKRRDGTTYYKSNTGAIEERGWME